jgi:hypothetical protein
VRRVRAVAAISGVYDGVVGILMLAGRRVLAAAFAVAMPVPPIHADLNGIFLLSIAAGYVIPFRAPDTFSGRAYLWVMGPALKGAGALAFVLDRLMRHSPRSFLLFAASDAGVALLTFWALRTAPELAAEGLSQHPSA